MALCSLLGAKEHTSACSMRSLDLAECKSATRASSLCSAAAASVALTHRACGPRCVHPQQQLPGFWPRLGLHPSIMHALPEGCGVGQPTCRWLETRKQGRGSGQRVQGALQRMAQVGCSRTWHGPWHGTARHEHVTLWHGMSCIPQRKHTWRGMAWHGTTCMNVPHQWCGTFRHGPSLGMAQHEHSMAWHTSIWHGTARHGMA